MNPEFGSAVRVAECPSSRAAPFARAGSRLPLGRCQLLSTTLPNAVHQPVVDTREQDDKLIAGLAPEGPRLGRIAGGAGPRACGHRLSRAVAPHAAGALCCEADGTPQWEALLSMRSALAGFAAGTCPGSTAVVLAIAFCSVTVSTSRSLKTLVFGLDYRSERCSTSWNTLSSNIDPENQPWRAEKS
jgi:hypothetical protein